MFEEYWEEKRIEEANQRSLIHRLEIPTIKEILPIEQCLNDIDKYSDIEASDFIDASWDIILNLINDNISNQNNSPYFKNVKIVSLFEKTLSALPMNLYFRYIPLLNYLCYNNISTDDKNLNKSIMSLSNCINLKMISLLIQAGLSREDSNMIMMARYSAPEINVNAVITDVTNINNILMSINASIPVIIDVYNIVFESMSDLFDGVMHSTSYDNSTVSFYNKVSCAMIEYLEQQTYDVIAGVLNNYSIDHLMYYNLYPVRFNLEHLDPAYYPRINSVYNALRSQGNTFPY